MSTIARENDIRSIHREYWRNRKLSLESQNQLFVLLNGKDKFQQQKVELTASLSSSASARLMEVCNNSDLSLYILLTTLVQGTIARFTGNPESMLLSPVYNQAGQGSPTTDFVVLKNEIGLDENIKVNTQRMRQVIVGAYSNQEFFLADAMAENFTNDELKEIFKNNVQCTLESIHQVKDISPMTIRFRSENGQLQCILVADCYKLDANLVEIFHHSLIRFIENVCLDFSQRINEIDLLTKEELTILTDLSKGEKVIRPGKKLHELVEDQVAENPTAIAIIHQGVTTSYGDLNKLANTGLCNLIAKGVKPGDRVALHLQRGSEMIAVILACLKVGAAFVPVSPDEPTERLFSIVNIVNPKLIISTDPGKMVDDKYHVTTPEELLHSSITGNTEIPVFDQMLPAYIIFTSGSTGTPKGVVIDHEGIVNAVLWKKKTYRYTTEDTVLLLFAYNFDGFILNLFSPLIAGSRIVIPDDASAKLPLKIADMIAMSAVTQLTSVPQMYHALLQTAGRDQLSTLNRVTLAGDTIRPETLHLSQELHPEILISNEYGPTENSVVTTYLEQVSDSAIRTIGRPIHNVKVYVLDEGQELVPRGVYGMLAIEGMGLAKEYLNDPELTNQAFVELNGKRVYLTGDIVRWLPNGNLEFNGRAGDQVKIRGFRIELEEVRFHLMTHPQVKEAVVLIIGEEEDKSLIACIRAEESLDIENLIAYLEKKLPFHMIPAQFVAMQVMPLLASGKYDIRRIKEQIADSLDDHEAEEATNETERQLIEIWKKVLGLSQVGVNQNFFALGGHSLKATSLLFEIHSFFKVDLSLDQIFTTNTVRELAEAIDAGSGKSDFIRPVGYRDYYPLTSAQKRLLTIEWTNGNSMAYNIPVVFALKGFYDIDRLQNTLNGLIRRHAVLRMRIGYLNHQPVQIIEDLSEINLIVSNLCADKQPEEQILELLTNFNLEESPLFRAFLLKENESSAYFVFDFHHIIVDEASLAIFFREFESLYHNKQLEELPLAYMDYAVWQQEFKQSEKYRSQLNYWKTKIASFNFSALNLPYSKQIGENSGALGDRVEWRVDDELFNGMQNLWQQNKTTSFIFFLSAFNVLLNKYTNQAEIIVGSPVSERTQTEIQDVLGLFLNTIPLLNVVNPEKTFVEFLEEVKSNVIEDIVHSQVQFDDIVRAIDRSEEWGKNPLFNVMIALIDNDVMNLELDGVISENLFIHNKTSKFDLLLEVHQSESEMMLVFEYSTQAFSKETILQIAQNFKLLLVNLVQQPHLPIGEINLLDDREREELILLGLKNYDNSIPEETTVSLFEQQVALHPYRVAIVLDDANLTYAELNRKVNQLAFELRKQMDHGDVIGVYCDRSFDAIISILAVEKSGGIYLPIDVTYPIERINSILVNSKTNVVLSNQENLATTNFNGIVLDLNLLDYSNNPESNPELAVSPDDNAYALFTSGTTGVPKGVLVSQRNLVNLVKKSGPYFPISDLDVFTMFHSYCFDVSVWELHTALLNGAKLVIVPDAITKSSHKTLELIEKHQVTILCQPPSAFYLLSEEMIQRAASIPIRFVILGGEAVKMYKFKHWYTHFPQSKLINGYGITETSVYSTYKEITLLDIEHHSLGIGTPIPANYIYILDEKMNPCPMGVPGEIFIGGLAVGNGYLYNDKLTNERFVQDPYNPGERLYKSGDLARWSNHGEVEYLGRLDHQVKVRGYRVEISEIESVFATFGKVRDIVVIGQKDEITGAILVAYYTSGQQESVSDIREYLAKYLSNYMVPSYFIQLDEIPLSSNGKVDRRKLPNPKTMMKERKKMDQKIISPQEQLLKDAWADILGLSSDQITPEDGFLSIGGDSISASLVVRKLNALGIAIDVIDILTNSTIAELAEMIREVDVPEEALIEEITAQWKAVSTTVATPILFPVEDERKDNILQLDIPGALDLWAITNKESNQIGLQDLLLTALGMSLRMSTGGNVFRTVILEETDKRDAYSSLHEKAYPISLQVSDINSIAENIANTCDAIRMGRKFGCQLAELPQDRSFKELFTYELIFRFGKTSHELVPNAEEENALTATMGDALRAEVVVNGGKIQCCFRHSEGPMNDRIIRMIAENLKFSLRQIVEHYASVGSFPLRKQSVKNEVTPFNDLFYRDCTYQAFLPAVASFGRDFHLIFANSHSVFEVEESGDSTSYKNNYISQKSDQQLLQDMGIQLNRYFGSANICNEIMNFVSNGEFAIVQIDCYYVPAKKELYGVKHGAHSMLVYGYDEINKVFFIVDNQSIEGANYQKNTISFDELEVAFNGYNEHFNPKGDQVTLYTLSLCADDSLVKHIKETVKEVEIGNTRRIKEELKRSHSALKKISAIFQKASLQEESMLEQVGRLSHFFGEAVNAKRIAKYKARTILENEELTSLFNEQLSHLEYIRNVLTKMELSHSYNPTSGPKMLEKFKRIIELENAYIERI